MTGKLAEQIRLFMMLAFGALFMSGGASLEDLKSLVTDLGNLLSALGAFGAAGTSLWAWKSTGDADAKD